MLQSQPDDLEVEDTEEEKPLAASDSSGWPRVLNVVERYYDQRFIIGALSQHMFELFMWLRRPYLERF